jgi:RNA-binding protein
MRTLTPAERRAFRARAHHLHPVVSVGHHGLTPAVLHEVDVNLLAHELIKIRVFSDDRDERERLLQAICGDLDAAPVQHLGKTLTLWRPAPERAPAVPKRSGRPDAAKGTARPSTAKPGSRIDLAKPKGRFAATTPKGRSGAPGPKARSAAAPRTRRRRATT